MDTLESLEEYSVNAQDSKHRPSVSTYGSGQDASCDVSTHVSKQEKCCEGTARASKQNESSGVGIQHSTQEICCDENTHNSKQEERCCVTAHDSKHEESHNLSAQVSKRKWPQVRAEELQQQVQEQSPDLLDKKQQIQQQQPSPQQQQQLQKLTYQQQKQSEHQRVHEQQEVRRQQQELQHLTVEHAEKEQSPQRQSQSSSQLLQLRQRQVRRDTNSDHRQEEQCLNSFPSNQQNERLRQQIQQLWQNIEQTRQSFTLVLDSYEYRMGQFFAVWQQIGLLTQPEDLDARNLLLHLAIALLLLLRYTRTFNLPPQMCQRIQRLLPEYIEIENETMNETLATLEETEQQLKDRTRRLEQHLHSQTATIQHQPVSYLFHLQPQQSYQELPNQQTYQQQPQENINQSLSPPPPSQEQHTDHQHNNPQHRQQHSAHASPSQPQPQALRSQEARLQEPETRHAGRLRYYHSTIQHLLEQRAHTQDDFSEQLVYLHLALAQLHLCEYDCFNSPSHPLANVMFLLYVNSLKHKVLKKIYHYEDQITAEAPL